VSGIQNKDTFLFLFPNESIFGDSQRKSIFHTEPKVTQSKAERKSTELEIGALGEAKSRKN
jgi:hypothetical protein